MNFSRTSHTVTTLFASALLLSASAQAMTKTANDNTIDTISSYSFSHDNHAPNENVRMFAKPAEGMKQHVIEMPNADNEDNLLLELQPGIVMEADCNVRMMTGKMELKNLQGWGYNYYELAEFMAGPSTMMMCNEPSAERFVPIGQPIKVRYNSLLPKVIYLPESVQLQYRVWQAPASFSISQ